MSLLEWLTIIVVWGVLKGVLIPVFIPIYMIGHKIRHGSWLPEEVNPEPTLKQD